MKPRSCLGPLLLATCFTLSLAACSEGKDVTTAAATEATSSSTDMTGSTSPGPTGTTGTDTPAIEPTTGPDATTADVTTSDTTSAEDPTTEQPSTGPGGLSWAVDVWPVLNPPISCDCHTAGSGGLKMGDAAEAHANLVDALATAAPLDRVEPGEVGQSYLVHKLNGTHLDVGGAGSMMPLGAPMLPQSTIDLIVQWILEGAAP